MAVFMMASSISYAIPIPAARDDLPAGRSGSPPIFVEGDEALSIGWFDESNAIVEYDMSYDGEWMSVGYLADHMDTTRLVYDEVWFLPPSIGLYADVIHSDEDYPLLDGDAPVGTGTLAVYFNYTTGQTVCVSIVIMGDVRGTGDLSVSQLVTMADMLRYPDGYTNLQIWAGDWTCDGKVDITDLIREARILLASQAPPLDRNDFILSETVDEEVAKCGNDIIAYLESHPDWNIIYYFENEPFMTSRGIHIGSSIGEVLRAYGIAPSRPYLHGEDILLEAIGNDQSEWDHYIESIGTEVLQYLSEDESSLISFYFDDQSRVICVLVAVF